MTEKSSFKSRKKRKKLKSESQKRENRLSWRGIAKSLLKKPSAALLAIPRHEADFSIINFKSQYDTRSNIRS